MSTLLCKFLLIFSLESSSTSTHSRDVFNSVYKEVMNKFRHLSLHLVSLCLCLCSGVVSALVPSLHWCCLCPGMSAAVSAPVSPLCWCVSALVPSLLWCLCSLLLSFLSALQKTLSPAPCSRLQSVSFCAEAQHLFNSLHSGTIREDQRWVCV